MKQYTKSQLLKILEEDYDNDAIGYPAYQSVYEWLEELDK